MIKTFARTTSFILLLAVTAHTQAVTVMVESMGDQLYSFETLGLNSSDLVVYRFSDGYHVSRTITNGNVTAKITRKFPVSAIEPNVIVYYARKNGPLGIAAPSDMGMIEQCSNCEPPIIPGMPAGTTALQMFWEHASNSTFFPTLTDNTTVPAFSVPAGMPWHILGLTAVPDIGTEKIQAKIPPGLQLVGVILKNKWIPSNSSGSLTDTHISNINFLNNKVVFTTLPAASGVQLNLYLVFSGQVGTGFSILHQAELVNKNRSVIYGQSSYAARIKKNPHDPNGLAFLDESVCINDMAPTPIRVLVNFQNEGAYPAEDVQICTTIPETFSATSAILTAASVDMGTITSSYINGVLCFMLNNIQLPGLNEEPYPEQAATKGWIEFQIGTRPCLITNLDEDGFNSEITFIAHQGEFKETIPTNHDSTKLSFCLIVNKSCDAQSNNGARSSQSNINIGLTCYPTVFQEQIQISGSDGVSPILYTLFDSTGKIWDKGETYGTTLYTATLPAGIYFCQLNLNDIFVTKKLVKQ